jgi:predicted metal-dependent enzyme (double-stranded beta helix superfamily)
MNSSTLEGFIAEAIARTRGCEPADCVLALAPLMLELAEQSTSFLEPRHYRSDPDHYARNLVYDAPDASLSLYTLVWLPGQWTPVHDHGTWGVVGVLQGMLEERSYMPVGEPITSDHGINLKRGGVILLRERSITSFVPNPDHIHMTGVPVAREMAVTLHLYGRNMNSFHIYDVARGTRRLIDVPHQKS